jgi:folylpolyglutamate synthase/dihydropteroate synthase
LISEEEFVEILNKILDLKIQLSYFEKCVLIAFEFFKKRKCEYVVLEVGL